MSTLPRTRSLGGADAKHLTLNSRERKRPSSLCESTWHKVDPLGGGQDRLKRTPSQANNLCTTVPTSLVPRTLGGRHTPTRNSLRHSRMAGMSRNVRDPQSRRWTNTGTIGRIAYLVIVAQILMGVMGLALSMWLLKWASFLPFREVPHFAGVLILFSGSLAAVMRVCLPRNNRILAHSLKAFLAILLLASIVSCACICAFTILHLINLAPMECRMRSDVVVHQAVGFGTTDAEEVTTTAASGSFNEYSSSPSKSTERLREKEYDEGSGSPPHSYDQFVDDEADYEYQSKEDLEATREPTSAPGGGDLGMHGNHCICETRRKGWRIVMNYPSLSCVEVKNVLPILFVASCVVCTVGGVLSSILLYLLWISRTNAYGPYGKAKNSEVKPFIFKSKFRQTEIGNNNGSPPKRTYLDR